MVNETFVNEESTSCTETQYERRRSHNQDNIIFNRYYHGGFYMDHGLPLLRPTFNSLIFETLSLTAYTTVVQPERFNQTSFSVVNDLRANESSYSTQQHEAKSRENLINIINDALDVMSA